MFVLQISCIIIILFLFILFMMERNRKKETQKLFSAILVVSVFQILFEILIMYTIQNLETVSPLLFKVVHRSYLTLVLTFFYLNFRYMSSFIREETDEPAKSLGFIHTAQLILYAGIFLLPLGYERTGTAVKFSYGPGVWVVYVGAAFYMFVILSNYCSQSRRIVRGKIVPLIFGVGCGMCACFYYMCIPTAYVTCLGVVIMNIAIYLSLCCPERCCPDNCRAESTEMKEEMRAYKVSFEAPAAHVLVVDDSEMNRKVIRNLLKKTKIQVDEASGGKECLELIKKNQYHMIFMDHLMPEMDGLETFDIMKRQQLCDKVPVIAMTANTVTMTEQDYIKYGFAGYISKPVVPEKLEVAVYELLDPELITVANKVEIEVQQTSGKETGIEENEVENADSRKWDEMPVVDGLDYQYAALHFQTTEEFVEMACFLITVMKSDREEIEGYMETLDQEVSLKNFQTKVHSMKNSAMTIGIVPLAGLAKTLEDAAREENEAQVHALMPVFVEKWDKYRGLLLENFGVDDSGKPLGDPESEEIKALFERLRKAATEMDIDELDVVMEEIDSYAFAPEYEQHLQEIRLAVVNFEVEYLQEEGYL